MAALSGTSIENELYCIVNTCDNIEEMAEEINMRVSAATRFLIESKPYSKINKVFNNKYTVQ